MSSPTKPNKALELLHEGVTQLLESENWKAALAFKAKLYSYSFNNCWLIWLQCPHASMVAGYHRWQELGRQVRKGEKGIAILAPLTRKVKDDEGEEKARVIFGFKTAYVFDVTQTDGEPLPDVSPKLLTDDSPEIREHIARFESFAAAHGHPVERKDLGGAKGSYNFLSRKITLRPDLPPLQTLKTLIHELAHAILHGAERPDPVPEPRSRLRVKDNLLELEAESCAFIVCHSLGLDTSAYSFSYLAHWTDDASELLPAGERACKAAAEILAAATTPSLEMAA
jgi:antirestriction protein ArdC